MSVENAKKPYLLPFICVCFALLVTLAGFYIHSRGADKERSERDRKYSELVVRNGDLVARVSENVTRVEDQLGTIKSELSGNANSLREVVQRLYRIAEVVEALEKDNIRLRNYISELSGGFNSDNTVFGPELESIDTK